MNTLKAIYTLLSSTLQKVRHLSTARLALVILAGSITAIACTWSYITDHSVRFNSYRAGRGFYRLPPLPIAFDAKTGKEISVTEEYNDGYAETIDDYEDWSSSDPKPSESDDAWEKAHGAVENGDLATARTSLQKFLSLTTLRETSDDPTDQNRRNSASDMLDAMTAQNGHSGDSVKEYLNARYAFDDGTIDFGAKRWYNVDLEDNWAYLQAAHLYATGAKEDASKAFQQFSAKYPTSEKKEAALYMAAKITMESSYSFGNAGCGVSDTTDNWGNEIETDKIVPIEKCQDDNWHAALKAFQQLAKHYPDGRYRNDVRGWLAYLYRRGGERPQAVAEYYRLLASTNLSVRLEAKKSLQIIGHEYDDETLNKVEELIADDPNAALAYAYHRIYNVAIDHTYADQNSWCCYDSDDQEEKRKIKEYQQEGSHELERVARFATTMIKRYPQAGLSGGFVMRVAEAQLELKSFADAERLARRALSLGVTGNLRAQALWIRGSSEHEMKRLAEARKTFNQLIAEFPDEKLTEGARRLLAMTAEDQDDLETALEQYLKLKYDYDVAYFIDVLLPTDRLATFIASHKDIPEHDKLLYALGIRYMRDKHWNEAREALSNVHTVNIPQVEDSDGKIPYSKEPDRDSDVKGVVRSSWVMQDLKTIDVLEHLENAAETAEGDEAKAEALYQLASYQYDGNSLMFYDPAVWQGQRADLLNQLSEGESTRLPNENRLIFEHSLLHEPLARAIPLYLEIIDKYPHTKAAKDAMYSAVIAHERLSDLNEYWRNSYSHELFVGSRYVTNRDIVSSFPHFRWPLSRLGWQASSRTVNGGPAYAPLLKPAPKLTRTQRAERILKKVTDLFDAKIAPRIKGIEDAYSGFWQSCFYASLTIVGVILVGYASILGYYFWEKRMSNLPGKLTLLASNDTSLEDLPDSESRVAKMIDA